MHRSLPLYGGNGAPPLPRVLPFGRARAFSYHTQLDTESSSTLSLHTGRGTLLKNKPRIVTFKEKIKFAANQLNTTTL